MTLSILVLFLFGNFFILRIFISSCVLVFISVFDLNENRHKIDESTKMSVGLIGSLFKIGQF